MNGVSTTRVAVRHDELDVFGRVHPASYLRYLAHAAVEASTAAGFGAAWYAEAGSVWLVRRSTFTVERPARAGAVLDVRTWVEDFRRVRSHRRYEIAGRDGARILAARTDWVYVDAASGRPRRVPEEMERAFAAAGSTPDPRPGWDAPPPPATTARSAHRVRVSELDSLGHVNNAVYLDVVLQAALDALEASGWPLDRLATSGGLPLVARVDLEHLGAARYGDTLETRTWFDAPPDGLDVHQDVVRSADGRAVARAATGWRWVDASDALVSPPGGLADAVARLRAA